jgi:hypothetical protein
MARTRARVKPMDSMNYPGLNLNRWYEVAPLWPGVTQRMTNLLGERLARIETPQGPTTVKASHFEFDYMEDEEDEENE